MPVLVNNLQEEVPVVEHLTGLLTRVVEETLMLAGRMVDAEVSLVFVNDEYIRRLNREYRGVDCPTDVLSFAMEEGEPMPEAGEEKVLGDVVISLETARRQGEEYGHGFQREVAYLTVHGVLHLLGYDHQEETAARRMREMEEAVLARVGLTREFPPGR
ncbi:rRNA maturation RNase YbeY [Desulfofundulus thermobenzoicus]|uniref:Endoribonuclease YbeY n=1 Tax=Desulfofundulus thermobenzoicus TaxID=29376 RepID=A0A6N7IMN1_9FIRM|nr:rRNA maturation RNase YbeY [Desulfofundulus thermobenzoicus]HHW43425.1 rRNA maturation RNase YbeY [Desulfotomaculum sp.]